MKKIEIDPDQLQDLHRRGLSDSKIAEFFSCSAETIRQRRIGLKLLSNQGVTVEGKHKKQTAIKLEILQPLVDQNLSDYRIAEILGYNHSTIFQARKSYKLERNSLRTSVSIMPTQRQTQLLVGHLLGDGSLRKDHTNTTGRISQGIAQIEYTKWKVNELTPLCGPASINTRLTPDKRNGIHYTSVDASIYANPALNWLHSLFYQNGYKELHEDMIPHISSLSIAVWFMDDGYISPHGYSIATNGFNNRVVLNSIFEKFKITISVHKSGVTYISTAYAKQFAALVFPHMIPSMHYKMHRSHVTPLIQGNSQSETILSQATIVI